MPLDVAAHHDHSADLADHRTERGHDRGQQGDADLAELGDERLEAPGAKGGDLLSESHVELLQRRQREAGDDGEGDDHLGDDHRPGGVEQAELAEAAHYA